jgi:hypothetical protein
MKALLIGLLFSCLLFANELTAQTAVFFDQANRFFATYAQHNVVKYQALYHHHHKELDDLVAMIKTMPVDKLSSTEQKAFYINAYNLLVIDNIVQHYPIASPNEIVEFWDEITYKVAGTPTTLEALERYILGNYQDARLHFVLVNGSVAAAPIANYAYQPDQLETQLKQRVIKVVNNPQWIYYHRETKQLKLPLLFKRYKHSFTPSVVEFLNAYRVEPIDADVSIVYTNEDWTLNSYESGFASVNKKKKKKEAAGGYANLAQVITLPKGQAEFINFNSIYTVGIGTKNLGSRNTYFNSYNTAFYGLTGKLDIGVSFLFRSSRERDDFSASPFEVMSMERTPLYTAGRATANSSLYADYGLSHMGLHVRFAPFKNLNLSFEQGLMLPIQNLPKDNTVDQSIYSVTQMYYIHPISSKSQLFFALTYWQGIRAGEQFRFQLPLLRGFFNYFVTPRLSLYATSVYFLEWGGGARYLLTPNFEIQFMYSAYLPIEGVYDLLSPGATSINTYNVGLRYRL